MVLACSKLEPEERFLAAEEGCRHHQFPIIIMIVDHHAEMGMVKPFRSRRRSSLRKRIDNEVFVSEEEEEEEEKEEDLVLLNYALQT